MNVKIYHNPRCSKSRQALDIIRQSGTEPEIIEYLETPPQAGEIASLLKQMGIEDPRDIMRKKEAAYKKLGLDDPGKSRDELLRIMAENPALLERPVVVSDKGVCLGRPPETIRTIL